MHNLNKLDKIKDIYLLKQNRQKHGLSHKLNFDISWSFQV